MESARGTRRSSARKSWYAEHAHSADSFVHLSRPSLASRLRAHISSHHAVVNEPAREAPESQAELAEVIRGGEGLHPDGALRAGIIGAAPA